MLQDIRRWNKDHLHIIVTSRDLADIEGSFSAVPTEALCLRGSAVNDDISLYITERLKNDRKLAKWPPEIGELIQRTLNCGACGM